ncbi:MAG: hypothetical protein GF320_12310 [Armatimonadia bacterium]|nr:hypothetical protein [Armatimonadia bacterium]
MSILQAGADWSRDFEHQVYSQRPALEVAYGDDQRESAVVTAERYRVNLDLRPDSAQLSRIVGDTREVGFPVRYVGADGQVYLLTAGEAGSRINLYRRGPYCCDVRWLDLNLITEQGAVLPARGEIALHCYPEKLHLKAVLHATGDVPDGRLEVDLAHDELPITATLGGSDAGLGWADVVGARADQPLPDRPAIGWAMTFQDGGDLPVPVLDALGSGAIELLEGVDARYDPVRGSYMLTTDNRGNFSYHYYEAPNDYETARFRIAAGDAPVKVYVCHETREFPGLVECGVLLDSRGDVLPLLAQISKNFGGEHEEPFYNPGDTPFSETFYPLYLEPGESHELTSHHLYQNWGNHALKQFSSLGAWMDYYHSSTGVTETTCYVPFKFGGPPGVQIADLRAMSQEMWKSQPQHDNVAGHRFVMYRSGGAWTYSEYDATEFLSTGPNWMHIGMRNHTGPLRWHLETFELPQLDELRNFIRIRVDVTDGPIEIDSLRTDLRMLDITTRIQNLRYTQGGYGAETPTELLPLDGSGLLVAGAPLLGEYPWATLWGDAKGANAFVVEDVRTSIDGRQYGPAVVIERHPDGNTQLALTLDGDAATLQRGDWVEADFYIMPYGDETATHETPMGDRVPFGMDAPRVVSVERGQALSDFPTRLRADERGAVDFIMAGGTDALPVIVEGLTSYTRPRLERLTEDGDWERVVHEELGGDGYQVFVTDDGGFGCVFLVQGSPEPVRYRARAALR